MPGNGYEKGYVGFGGSGGGSGTIGTITSDDGSIVVTDSTGPSTNLAVEAGLPGRLLATQYYAPAGGSYPTITNTFAAVDTTNLTLAFTVPSSGIVDIAIEGEAALAAGASQVVLFVGLFAHGGSTQVGVTKAIVYAGPTDTVQQEFSGVFHLTGLTPGALQLDIAAGWVAANTPVAVDFYIQGAQGLNGSSPFRIQAFASI